MKRSIIFLLLSFFLAGCAQLGGLGRIEAPVIEAAESHPARLQLIAPSLRHPVGGVQLRLFARVSNPNPLALTLTRLAGTLALEGSRAAEVNLPLGLPLPAAADTVIPLDIEIGFANLPGLAETLPRAVQRGSVDYHLHGSFAVDAGILGQPSFGPMTLLQGEVQTSR